MGFAARIAEVTGGRRLERLATGFTQARVSLWRSEVCQLEDGFTFEDLVCPMPQVRVEKMKDEVLQLREERDVPYSQARMLDFFVSVDTQADC